MKRSVPEPFFNKVAGVAWNSINKETLAQVFSCEFCEIFKNTYFTEHLRTTAFVHIPYQNKYLPGTKYP